MFCFVFYKGFIVFTFLTSFFFPLEHSTQSSKPPSKGNKEYGIILTIDDSALCGLRVLHENSVFQLSIVREGTICLKWVIIDISTYFNVAGTMTNVSSSM